MIAADEPRKFMSGIYIEYPKQRICLWAPISAKETTHVFQNKKTQIGVSMDEASSTPKAMEW